MTLLELNEVLRGNYDGQEETKRGVPTVEQKEVEEFLKMFSIEESIKTVFDMTENYVEFYNVFPWMKLCFSPIKAKELFYAAKTEILYQDVPPTIIFLFKKAIQQFEGKYVNLAISKIERKMLYPYLKDGILPDDITYNDVLDNIVGRKVKLIRESCPCVNVDGVTELYVSNVDSVALVPTEMLAEVTDLEGLVSAYYDKEKGIMIKDIPIRTFGGRIGLTRNDFDLRSCL